MSTSKSIKRYDHAGKSLRLHETEKSAGGYQYAYKDAMGRWCRISAPTLERLREREKQVEHNALIGIATDSKTTVNRYFEIWIASRQGVKQLTIASYKTVYNSYIRPTFLGSMAISKVSHSDILRLYTAMSRTKSINTIRNAQSVLRQVFELAVLDGIIYRNPCSQATKGISKQIKATDHKQALTIEEQKRFINYLKSSKSRADKRNYYMIILLLDTGLRASELCALRWQDVDFEANLLHITHSMFYVNSEQHLGSTKTRAGVRDIPMTDAVRTALLTLKQTYTPVRTPVDGYVDFVFHTNRHHAYTNAGVKTIVVNAVERCNKDAEINGKTPILPRFTPHVLRHTFCTNLIAAGANIKSVQSIMGHDDIKITLQVYTSVTKQTNEDAIKSLREWEEKSMTDLV